MSYQISLVQCVWLFNQVKLVTSWWGWHLREVLKFDHQGALRFHPGSTQRRFFVLPNTWLLPSFSATLEERTASTSTSVRRPDVVRRAVPSSLGALNELKF